MWYSQYSAKHEASSADYAHCTHAQKHKQRTDTHTHTQFRKCKTKYSDTLSLCLIYMHTLSSTLRPDTQYAFKAKVVLLANDPLHTPHIQQREGLTEHKKRGITPHSDHWNSRGVCGSVGARRRWITWRSWWKETDNSMKTGRRYKAPLRFSKEKKRHFCLSGYQTGMGIFYASKAPASTFSF